MTDVKLSDQLGAMAIIDELYQQQTALEELLNPIALRQTMAQRIREYYRSRGMDIQDALIEQGVDEWFADRLRFSMPKPAWHQRLLARLYLKRKRVFRVFFSLLMVAVALIAINVIAVKMTKNTIAGLQQVEQSLLQKINGHHSELLALNGSELRYASASGEALRSSSIALAEKAMKQGRTFAQVVAESSSSYITLSKQKASLNGISSATQIDAQSIEKKLAQYRALADADRQLQQIADDSGFAALSRRYAPLRQAFERAAASMSESAEKGLESLKTLESAYRLAQEAQAVAQEAERSMEQLKRLVPTAQERSLAQSDVNDIQRALAQFDLVSAKRSLEHLRYLTELAPENLTLTIVDRVGEKSGVERTYEDSGGKTWYIIVEALTPSGQPFPLWLTDAETGQSRRVTTFGLQVSRNDYDRVRNDKLDDGRIQKKQVGKKSSGRLNFSYTRSTSGSVIMEW
ncbi:Uncharacterised protein [Leminorella richardii]|uniref:Uncharacterized protein n=1 Tax=Leminorella richardii TaxID=158841 RepID=A0A2X4UXJ0_9GAMM|nr:DUF6384 family protein [Leminorella richardii]SQI43531.1 Uncharacterised protein [Leminorella richardii]